MVTSRSDVWRHRGRVLQAMVLVSAAGAAQKWVPMVKWSRVLGEHGAVPAAWRGHAIEALPASRDTEVENQVAGAIRAASRHLPWKPTCLAEATAGQVMLRRRGAPGVVVIGLRPGPTGQAKWDAHAWLLGTRGALTGGPAAKGFTATTVFEVADGLRADDVSLND